MVRFAHRHEGDGIGTIAVDAARSAKVGCKGVNVPLELRMTHGQRLGKAQPRGMNRRGIQVRCRQHTTRQWGLPKEHRPYLRRREHDGACSCDSHGKLTNDRDDSNTSLRSGRTTGRGRRAPEETPTD